jgi:nucleoid-associated protein YgaU
MADPKKPDYSGIQSGSSTTSRPASSGQEYTVVKGDSLSKIAKRFYGDASQWPRIHEANRAQIEDPDLIHPGQVLTIPNP